MNAALKIRVVLADDHPVVREGLAALINQQGDMEVVADATDGEQAIAAYEQHRPDLMMLDLRMPKLDGLAVIERVLKAHPEARLLVVTSYDDDEDIFQSLTRGAKGYLLKDASRREILSAIRTVCEDRPHTPASVVAKALERMTQSALTDRENEVLQLLIEGYTNRQIAQQLQITASTARSHVRSILTKLDASNRTEAVVRAHKRGLIRLQE